METLAIFFTWPPIKPHYSLYEQQVNQVAHKPKYLDKES